MDRRVHGPADWLAINRANWDARVPALDTLSWARRGAIVVQSASFVLANVYDAAAVLAGRTFDIVYSSIGSLQFLPDIEGWARVVAALVAPGGLCYVTEGHPFLQFVEDDGRWRFPEGQPRIPLLYSLRAARDR